MLIIGLIGCTFLAIVIFVYGFYYFAILKRNRLTAFSDSLLKSQKNQDSNANLPAVSIIVSTFNEASVIERKIGNLSTLSYPQNLMEIIVYDDASNDETGSIATKALKENNLYGKVIINPHRLGLNRSLNMAIAEAKYNFICITDSDVILVEGCFEKCRRSPSAIQKRWRCNRSYSTSIRK